PDDQVADGLELVRAGQRPGVRALAGAFARQLPLRAHRFDQRPDVAAHQPGTPVNAPACRAQWSCMVSWYTASSAPAVRSHEKLLACSAAPRASRARQPGVASRS